MFFNLTESPWLRAGRQYAFFCSRMCFLSTYWIVRYLVRDLWSHTNNFTAVRNVTIKGVPAHGVAALLLTDAGDEPEGLYPPCSVWEWCMVGVLKSPDCFWAQVCV